MLDFLETLLVGIVGTILTIIVFIAALAATIYGITANITVLAIIGTFILALLGLRLVFLFDDSHPIFVCLVILAALISATVIAIVSPHLGWLACVLCAAAAICCYPETMDVFNSEAYDVKTTEYRRYEDLLGNGHWYEYSSAISHVEEGVGGMIIHMVIWLVPMIIAVCLQGAAIWLALLPSIFGFIRSCLVMAPHIAVWEAERKAAAAKRNSYYGGESYGGNYRTGARHVAYVLSAIGTVFWTLVPSAVFGLIMSLNNVKQSDPSLIWMKVVTYDITGVSLTWRAIMLRKIKKDEPLSLAFKICSIFFLSILGGIALLFDRGDY